MWLVLEYSTRVNFREPTPAKARRQSTFTLACLNLRREARKHGSRSPDRPMNQREERCGSAGLDQTLLYKWYWYELGWFCHTEKMKVTESEFDIKDLVNKKALGRNNFLTSFQRSFSVSSHLSGAYCMLVKINVRPLFVTGHLRYTNRQYFCGLILHRYSVMELISYKKIFFLFLFHVESFFIIISHAPSGVH